MWHTLLHRVRHSTLRTSMLGKHQQVSNSAARARVRRVWLKVHRWIGLSLGLVLIVAAVSGSAMLIADPLDKALNPHIFTAPNSSTVDYPAVLAALKNEVDASSNITLRPPRQPEESLHALIRGPWRGTIYLNPTTAEILGRRAETEGTMGFLFALHSHLFAGEIGKIVLTLSAFAYLCLLASGVYLWWPKRWSQAFNIRLTASSLRALFDWHRVTGAILGIGVLVSVASGAYMTWQPFAQAVTYLSGGTATVAPKVQASAPSGNTIALAVDQARSTYANASIGYIQVPAKPDQPIRIRMRMADDPHPNGLTSLWLDPSNAQILQINHWASLDLGTRAYSYIYPLHTGELWGISWMVITFIFGVTLFGYGLTGILLWWRKR